MLRYMSLDPLFRKGNHNSLTFSFFLCVFRELHPADLCTTRSCTARALYNKMPGTPEQKAAGVRCFCDVYDGAPGQKAALWARNSRSTTSGISTRSWSGASLQHKEHRQAQEFLPGAQRVLHQPRRALGGRFLVGGLLMDLQRRRQPERYRIPPVRQEGQRADRRSATSCRFSAQITASAFRLPVFMRRSFPPMPWSSAAAA